MVPRMHCAWEGCTEPRLEGSGTNSYCRAHKNEMARRVRHRDKAPEVVETRLCRREACTNTFTWSSWGRSRVYCSTECYELDPAERRAAAREERRRQAAEATERKCSTPGCGVKPISEFHIVKGKPSWRCKECQRKANKAQYDKDPERVRGQKRVSRRRASVAQLTYGGRPMTLDDVAFEMQKQEGRCALCSVELTSYDVDHDHATGVFRGLLCRKCNLRLHDGVGPEWFRRAARYLESSRCTDVNAAWCPIHGDCTCETQGPAVACPLHDTFSMHGEAQFHDGLVPVEG